MGDRPDNVGAESRPLQGADGGEEGIRTPVTLSGKPDFESGTFSHSVTSPAAISV